MNLDISIRVMAHPKRVARAQEICDRLSPYDAQIVLDPDPTANPSAMRAARLAWADVPPNATHHVVLQDDATLPEGFYSNLAAAIKSQPGRVIALCSEWSSRTGQSARAAAYAGASWTEYRNSSVWAVGVSMPAERARQFSRYIANLATERDSWALYMFTREIDEPAITPVPSLVQHDEHASVSQWSRTIDQGPRRAAVYLDSLRSDHVWNSTVFSPSRVSYIPCDRLSAFVSEPVDGGARHTNRPATDYQGRDYVAALGETQETIASLFRESTKEFVDAMSSRLSEAFQFQVWICAVILAIENHRNGMEVQAHSKAAVGASKTMAVGPMKRILPVSELNTLVRYEPKLVNNALSIGSDLYRRNFLS